MSPATLIKLNMTMGARIRSARKQAGIKQVEVARHINVSAQAVNNWEADKYQPTKQNLLALAKLFGVSVAVLLQDNPLPEHRSARTVAGSTGVVQRGRVVPLISHAHISIADKSSVAKSSIYASYPCSVDAFAIEVTEKHHGDALPIGSIIIFDPAMNPDPGDFVLASQNGKTICGVLTLTEPGNLSSAIVTPLDSRWPAWRSSDTSPILVIAVKTETHLRG